ncbi:MAG TPA: hypothetical protein DEP72_05955 [Clostridiales bacterium]|nr:MAG: hypothetical protein A2Y18_08430 [Clostridiales bacterium GWD2_32_19]HCC07682.1 hypothetical protein [Clostridiales bacterium]
MRIGVFTDTYWPQTAGIDVAVKLSVKALKEAGNEVYIITPDDPRITVEEREKEKDDNVIRVPSIKVPGQSEGTRLGIPWIPSVIKKIESLNLDVVHSHTEFTMKMMAGKIAKRNNIKHCYTYHTMFKDISEYLFPSFLKEFGYKVAKWISIKSCSNCDEIIVPSEKVRDTLINYGIKKEIKVVPTEIDKESINQVDEKSAEVLELKKRWGICEGEPVLLAIGRLEKDKEFSKIIEQMPKIIEKNPNTKLMIVGQGPLKSKLELLAKKLDVESAVIFVGGQKYDDMGKYYKLGNILINAATAGTQGLIFSEAMAAGIPIITIASEGLTNRIKETQSGIVADSIEQIPDEVLRVIEDETVASELVENGHNYIKSGSKETYINTMLGIYSSGGSESFEKDKESDEKGFQEADAMIDNEHKNTPLTETKGITQINNEL